jgi:molybdenum cofactor cytidylyltransferase
VSSPSLEGVLGVVLAAGGGTRYKGDTHKLLAPLRGRPVVTWAVEHAIAAGFAEVVVVTGAADLAGVMPAGARLVANPAWADGQATSLAVAVGEARRGSYAAVVVGLGDQPFVPPECWSAVGAAAGPLATATFDGVRTPPVRIARELWGELPTSGDEGARVLMRGRPDLVSEIACRGQAIDIDTVEDLRPWS